jgi:hypothetical protein
MRLFSHLRGLLKKEWLLWKRNIIRSLLELIVPPILLFILVVMRAAIPMDEMPSTYNLNLAQAVSLEVNQPEIMGLGNSLLNLKISTSGEGVDCVGVVKGGNLTQRFTDTLKQCNNIFFYYFLR